jgi:hypothetical protein
MRKLTRRKISFPNYKTFCFLFGPLLLSYFLFILNDLKCYKSATWSFTNHVGVLIATKQRKMNYLGV